MWVSLFLVLLLTPRSTFAVFDESNVGWTFSLNAVQANMNCNTKDRIAIHSALLKALNLPRRRLRSSVQQSTTNDACNNVCPEGSDCFIAHPECLHSERHLQIPSAEMCPNNTLIHPSDVILGNVSDPRFANVPKRTVLTHEMREKCQAAKDPIVKTLQTDLANVLEESCQLLLRSYVEISCVLISSGDL
jgi:hypothetical protein